MILIKEFYSKSYWKERTQNTQWGSSLMRLNITLPTKFHIVKALIFPVVLYGCESWTIKKAEHWRIDAFDLWCWRRLLRVPWSARRSNQSILKEISLEYSLEGLMLKLKLQYFVHLMWRADLSEKTLMLGKIEGRRRRRWQRMRRLEDITVLMDMSLSKLWGGWRTGKPGMPQSMGLQRVGHNWATKQQQSSLRNKRSCRSWAKNWWGHGVEQGTSGSTACHGWKAGPQDREQPRAE